MAWLCVLMEPTGTCRRWLRRYRSADDRCPARTDGGSYCEALVEIEDGPVVWHRDADGHRDYYTSDVRDWPRDDPRWPTACAHCGQPFTEGDVWQLHYDQLFRHPATGALHTYRDMPVGAIWRADWHEGHWHGPDGKCYVVQLPPGGLGDQWVIDGPSSSGGGWTRTGEAPNLTVVPSINAVGRYHGWLTAGYLTDDCEGRRF